MDMLSMGFDKIIAIIPARGGSKGVPRKNMDTYSYSALVCRKSYSFLEFQLPV
jgi:CMP-N-acetylneuraminic acid synthetase